MVHSTMPIRVCPKCGSDQIVKKKGLIKCLECGKKSRDTATIWIVKEASDGTCASRITQIIDNKGYTLRRYLNNKRFKGNNYFGRQTEQTQRRDRRLYEKV